MHRTAPAVATPGPQPSSFSPRTLAAGSIAAGSIAAGSIAAGSIAAVVATVAVGVASGSPLLAAGSFLGGTVASLGLLGCMRSGQRSRDEEHLRSAAQRYRSLVESADVITWEYDVDAERFTYVSPQAARLGHSPERWLEPGFWRDMLHPVDRDAALSFCASQIAAARAHRFQYRMRTAAGEWVWVDDFASEPVRESGRLLLRGMLVDITERVALEKRMAATEQLLERTGEIAGVGGWELEAETNVLRWTAATCRLHGLPPDHRPTVDEAIDFYEPDARPVIRAAVEAAMSRQEPFDLELPMQTRDGRRIWVRSAGRPDVEGGKTVRVLGAFQDITARKAIDERIERANLELRDATDRASAMAIEAAMASTAKSSFLATMSHEIRTPMTAILGFADLLAEEGDRQRAPAQRLDYIDTIKRNGEHLLALINDILDVSKIEAGKMTVERVQVRPEQLLLDVASLMSVRASAKSIGLSIEYETAVPSSIESDPLRLKQILVNLIGNAIKFTERGSVRVRVTLDRDAVGGPHLVMAITDSGIGMTPAQVRRLFGAYQQADATTARRFGGTGLGLVISKELACLLGGDIHVTSVPGEGSTFTVRVATGPLVGVSLIEPTVAQAALHEPPAVDVLNGRPLEGVRILLAEDGPDNRRLVSFHLTKAGASVEAVEHGGEALRRLTVDGSANGPLALPSSFDVVLTDIQMPEVDGYALASALRAKGWPGRIIALTANAMNGDAERCMAAGCDGYASKPIDRNRLIELCRTSVTDAGSAGAQHRRAA